LNAFGEDDIAGLQSLLYDPVAAHLGPCGDGAALYFVAGDDDIHLAHALPFHDRALRNGNGLLELLSCGAHSPKLSRAKHALGIGEPGLQDDASGAGADRSVDQGEPAFFRVHRPICQDQLKARRTRRLHLWTRFLC
jgi:hypothetical protein